MSSDTWTVGRLLKWTTDFLKQRGAESPRLDAEVLLASAKGCERIALYTSFEDEADEPLRTRFRELVKRRADGTPVAYLVGKREFYSLPFEVTPDVLIPRPETEHLVIEILDRAKELGAGTALEIADVGTGSGIIAVCAAKQLPQARLTAIDISPAALEVAKRNAARHKVSERLEFLVSDLFAALPAERKFQIIASNPPYVSESELAALAPDVRDHEPRGALVAGPRGTEVIERLIPQAAARLTPGGWLMMELSPMIESAVRDLIVQQGGFQTPKTIKDLAGLPRIVTARRHS
ncbi:MAG: peptide chain release factor N(5)-glutamine methyltransferase [Planctomycetia bacterium]|nr:peptide chain release factor N(5)-glutamine methyltransferase [Planctomycetia bacterium]